MVWPKFVVFKSLSNGYYLCPSGSDNNLKFDAEVVYSTGVKHEVVMAESNSRLVHIKCCDTGKYWSWGGKNSNVIIAQADQPQEDITKNACTLIRHKSFKPKSDGVTFVKLQGGYNGSWHSICGFNGYLVAGGTAEDIIMSDWEKMIAKQPTQPQGSNISIANTTIEHGVLIGNPKKGGRVSIGKTKIGGDVSVDNKNTGVVWIGNTTIGHDAKVRGSLLIGETTIEGDVSVGNPTPDEE